MRKILFIILLTFNILPFLNTTTNAQETSPSYQSLITLGDKEFNKGEYISAKSYYQEALRIKKDDSNAKNKLNKTLQKIKEQGEKEEVFYQYIDEADNHYNNGDYEKALASYNKARNLFPKDEYTTSQINSINEIIRNEKDKLAAFNERVQIADDFMSKEKFTEALLQYKSALELYPNHTSTKDKLENAKRSKEEYDKQLSNFEQLKRDAREFALRKKYAESIAKYEEAQEIFPNDDDVKELISSLTATKIISDNYNLKIREADSLYLEKSYEKAKKSYNEALAVIPDDQYSSDMIKRIDETINSDEYKSLKTFLALIEEAKALENDNKMELALDKYKSALRENPNDEFTIQKIDLLTNAINERNKEIETNALYASLIKDGDNSANNDDYYSALDYYKQADKLIPNRLETKEKIESTQKRINEIEAQLAIEKQKWEEYYNTAMASAETFMNENNYPEAIKEYNKALRYKENDAAAKQGLNSATQLNDARLANIINEYNKYISNADIQFGEKNYDKAMESYAKANELDTGYTYPSEMINKINKILEENKLEQLVGSSIQIKPNETKRFTFNKIDISLRKGNYIFIKAKNLSERSYAMFISYGDNNGKKGSLVLRIPNNQNVNDYIIKIGAQYDWFRNDNTWIEITPENGEIEIELMEITKGN